MTATPSNQLYTWSVLGKRENRLMLGQVKVENKSNEITAIPDLLKLLDITGCIITIDAMGTQTEIAKQILDQGADYILCLKANHPTLWNEVKTWCDPAQSHGFEGIEHSYDLRVEAGHHRHETRFCLGCSPPGDGTVGSDIPVGRT